MEQQNIIRATRGRGLRDTFIIGVCTPDFFYENREYGHEFSVFLQQIILRGACGGDRDNRGIEIIEIIEIIGKIEIIGDGMCKGRSSVLNYSKKTIA